MGIESINNAASTYQGSVSSAGNNSTGSTINQTTTPNPNVATVTETARGGKSSASQQNNSSDMNGEATSDNSIKKAVEDINRQSANTEAIFGYHEGTNRVMIKIIDKDTKEVKKEYPAEKTLDMIQKVWEMAGLMVDEKR